MNKITTLVLMLSVFIPGQVNAAEIRLGLGGYDYSDTAYTLRTPVEIVVGDIVYFVAGSKHAYTPTGVRFAGIWGGMGLDYRYYITENLSIRPFTEYQTDLASVLYDKFFVEIFGGTPQLIDASRTIGLEIGLTKTIGIAAYYRLYSYRNGRLSDVTGLSGTHEYRGVMLYFSQQI